MHVHAKHYKHNEDGRTAPVFAAMVPYHCATRGTSLRKLEYTHTFDKVKVSGAPGLVDRVLALHAGSRGFDSYRGTCPNDFSGPLDQDIRTQ